MRVVAGKYGGRRLYAPKGQRARPTTDRVKESLFAILRADIPRARVLDLFAGCGNLGIEALSRGAAHCTFVDAGPTCVRVIRDNLAALGIERGQVRVIRGDARQLLGELAERGESFDVVFLDPPYDGPHLVEDALRVVAASRVLSEEGVAVVEHARRSPPADFYGPLRRVRVEDYGDTTVSLFRRVVLRESGDLV
jgi:16S rRNA (guanine(966)-N(2))-methyltransferase RsmD